MFIYVYFDRELCCVNIVFGLYFFFFFSSRRRHPRYGRDWSSDVCSLDLGALLAGTKYRGDFEKRLKGLLADLKKEKHAILFIDEIHTIIGAGRSEEHTSELQSRPHLVCRLLLEKKK